MESGKIWAIGSWPLPEYPFFPLGLGLDIYYPVNSNERDGETTVLTSASQEKSFYQARVRGGLSCCATPMFGSLLFSGTKLFKAPS